jgi:hypothetical protein
MTYFKSKTVHSWTSANQLLNEVEQDMTNYQLKPDVINRSRMLRLITQTESLIFLHILRKPNSINVSLFKRSMKDTLEHCGQWRRGTHVLSVFLERGKGSTFSTNRKKIFRKIKNFSGRQHFKSLSPPPPSTTLTISDNLDNFKSE